VLVVEDIESNTIVGTVQVVLTVPEDQPHRADVAKMLVHRRARGRGLGAALVQAAEAAAREAGCCAGYRHRQRRRTPVHPRGLAALRRDPGYALWPKGGLCSTMGVISGAGGLIGGRDQQHGAPDTALDHARGRSLSSTAPWSACSTPASRRWHPEVVLPHGPLLLK
jgi:predicted GNAT family acetyltransferase